MGSTVGTLNLLCATSQVTLLFRSWITSKGLNFCIQEGFVMVTINNWNQIR
jgi:hypothetical protein